jgi:hypothetical protein
MATYDKLIGVRVRATFSTWKEMSTLRVWMKRREARLSGSLGPTRVMRYVMPSRGTITTRACTHIALI